MIYLHIPTSEEQMALTYEKELNSLYEELESTERRWIRNCIITGSITLFIGFMAGVEFVLYKVFGN